MNPYLTSVVCLLSGALCLVWVIALHYHHLLRGRPDAPSLGVRRQIQTTTREMFLFLGNLFFPLLFLLLQQRRAELAVVPIVAFFCLLGCVGLMWVHYARIRDASTEHGAAAPVRMAVMASLLAFYPLCLYVETSGHFVSLVALTSSFILLGHLVGPIEFLCISAVSALSLLLIGHFLAPAQLRGWLSNSQLQFTLLQVFLTSGAISLLRKKEDPALEKELILEKLEIAARKILQAVSDVIGLIQSHGNVIELCCKSMQPVAGEPAPPEPEEEQSQKAAVSPEEKSPEPTKKLHLEVDADVYEMLLERLEKFHEANRHSSQTIHHLLRPIRLKIQRSAFSQHHISSCVYQAIKMCSRQRTPDTQLEMDLGEDFLFWGCKDQLITALVQLLENALQYTPKEGKVSIWTKEHQLYIKNSGISLSAEEVAKLFTPFSSTQKGHLGLGLYYVQRVMEAFGGRVHHLPCPGEKATCFVLYFPEAASDSGAQNA